MRNSGGDVHFVDLITNGVETVDSTCDGDDSAAGLGEVDVKLDAEAGGGADDHDVFFPRVETMPPIGVWRFWL